MPDERAGNSPRRSLRRGKPSGERSSEVVSQDLTSVGFSKLSAHFVPNSVSFVAFKHAILAEFGTVVAAGEGFDYSGDGLIGPEDISGWLSDASQASNTANPNGATYIIGDADLDGNVVSIDLGLLLNNFNASSDVGWNQGDFDGDGIVNSIDLGLLLNGFGFSSAASVNVVPEPNFGGLSLLMLGFFALVNRRKPT